MLRKLIHIFDLLQSILIHRRGHYIKYINYQMSQDLLIKAEKDMQLKAEMQKNQIRYKKLLEAYSTKQTPSIPQSILKQINDSREIYFYLGFQQKVLNQDMWQLQIFLIKNFRPRPKKPFTLVFFNEKAKDNYVFSSFRQFFSSLPFQILNQLQEFIVVKPYFYHKTMDWMMFGKIPKYIKSRTKFVYSYKQLCDHLKISMNILAEYIPHKFYQSQLQKFQVQDKYVQNLRMNIKGQQRGQVDNKLVLQFQKSITSMIIKPGYEINNLQDYEISDQGIPTILKMLIFYFDSHEDGLNLEGLFRKSVSIDQENETIREVLSNNYDYLLQVQNPHIIANLIKRFFSTLKNPAFPFSSFEKLMNDQGVQNKVQYFKQIFDQIPALNKRSLLFLFTFFKDKVIRHESQNKMSIQNVAICLSPCIFRSRIPSAADLLYATKSVMYCKMFLSEFDFLFGSVEEIEKIYRTSFKESQQKLQQSIQMTLQFVVETLVQNQLQMKGNKRVSHRYENQMEQTDPIQIKLEEKEEEIKKVASNQQKIEELNQKAQQIFLDSNEMEVPNFRNSMSFEDQGTQQYFFELDNSGTKAEEDIERNDKA